MIKKCTGCGIILQAEDINKEGYTENDIAKIWGGNLLRVMHKAQSAPDNSL